ncbi:MAG: alpha-glucan family phosphorylase [Sedimentisphaerales bacterium]|nr:alpha-glucan family phosphorylase [Sedimentisphaerales bacterium]
MLKIRNYTVLPALPETLKDLQAIAANLFWSWNPELADLFARIDSSLWHNCGHNPIKLLGNVSQERLNALAENQGFLAEVQKAADKVKTYLEGPNWFKTACSASSNLTLAYFSAEFGIHECLPIYAGGLGILAGDHLKSASDLGLPIIGVGLLYQKGYFRQYLNVDGWQQEVYIENDFYNMPLELVRGDNGQPLTISVEYPGREVFAQVWCASVGRAQLYLLDTNLQTNSATDRMITTTVYGGDTEMRIRQEIMLGIGGMRALQAMGIKPTVCHLNEGHTAFSALERIRQLMSESKVSCDQALEAIKAGTVFTVHTPVRAGVDEFSTELMDKYFSNYASTLRIDEKRLLSLGRILPDDEGEVFKMPVLAMRLSSYTNGVSELHGRVSRDMWSCLWRRVPTSEVPISSITNGVHIKSWISEEMSRLYERYLGPNWADEDADSPAWANIDQISDEEFWRCHQRCKERLIAFARRCLKAQMEKRGSYHSELNRAEEVLDPEALTIGFARRFAGYKRANLLLKDPARLAKLLTDPKKTVQFIFAGKAHPRDNEGKEIIREIVHFAAQFDVRRNVVFLEDYDINITKMLVQGVDVWLNNPRRPWEASGTSGMKAAINGALNMSTLDGWWCEGYRPEGGWAIGAGETYDDPGYQDMVESQAIYNMLENEVIPLFHTRSADNLPRAWIHRVRKSMRWITPRFNTRRMVMDYAQRCYLPANSRWAYLTADNMSRAKALAAWKLNTQTAWGDLAIKDVQVELGNGVGVGELDPKNPQLKVGSKLKVSALVELGKLKPDDVSVELYHGPLDARGNITDGSVIKMEHKGSNGHDGEHWFSGLTPCCASGRRGVAVRVVPKHPDMTNPHELGLILWEPHAEKLDE